MHIQVNTDANIEGHEELIRHIEAEVKHTLNRFAARIMRVEVHLADENGAKYGSTDKRCVMEARCSGHTAVAVSDKGATLEGAFRGAARKLQRLLESSLGKAGMHRGSVSLHAEQFVKNEGE